LSIIVVLYSAKPETAHILLSLLPYKDEIVKTSVAVSKPSSPATLCSSNFTQPKLTAAEFLQKNASSIKLANALTVIPILPAVAVGAVLAYQLLKPDKLPPIVPKAPFLHPGSALSFVCKAFAFLSNFVIAVFVVLNSFFNSLAV
jgi:hypothetical protein